MSKAKPVVYYYSSSSEHIKVGDRALIIVGEQREMDWQTTPVLECDEHGNFETQNTLYKRKRFIDGTPVPAGYRTLAANAVHQAALGDPGERDE